jgi:solute carrier family 25 phosphate transporter 23/24/25/41
MAVPQLVRNVEHGFDESQNQRDARVEELWVSLEPERTGELDLKGLKKGLRKIDHRERCRRHGSELQGADGQLQP